MLLLQGCFAVTIGGGDNGGAEESTALTKLEHLFLEMDKSGLVFAPYHHGAR